MQPMTSKRKQATPHHPRTASCIIARSICPIILIANISTPELSMPRKLFDEVENGEGFYEQTHQASKHLKTTSLSVCLNHYNCTNPQPMSAAHACVKSSSSVRRLSNQPDYLEENILSPPCVILTLPSGRPYLSSLTERLRSEV